MAIQQDARLGRQRACHGGQLRRHGGGVGEESVDQGEGDQPGEQGQEPEEGDAGDLEMSGLHKLFFFTRSDTIYGGSNEIQKNVIGERALGLPREPKI